MTTLMDVIDELVAEEIEIIDELIEEEVKPILEYKVKLEKDIFDKAYKEVLELEGGK